MGTESGCERGQLTLLTGEQGQIHQPLHDTKPIERTPSLSLVKGLGNL